MTLPNFNNLKLHMKLDDDSKMFTLFVNGVNFLNLPYKYDVTPEGDFSVIRAASVRLDAK